MTKLDLNNPVVTLTGDEFLPKPGITFAQQVLDFFNSQGGRERLLPSQPQDKTNGKPLLRLGRRFPSTQNRLAG